ncbi:hypothetical protein CWE15_05390 [Aliidiomarina taiwanensis]|uniref:Uncharacterized protein n=1 Tax=Aliidiomarina taiwanensis TaxID=946228 RepID=A0A432X7K6_9GAMM|nr:prepilin-type N-terminal cleavage/methylation domain-containing protein [Aliidiomarina taiwanensis]RUO42838.1 hypothetical protein CWE15_05390 [Aliidiomarina taiwanensis]
MKRSKRQSAGFTLVELIIVIVVISILAVTAVPRFMANDPSTELATLEARLMGLLRLQQQRAMQDGASCCYGVTYDANAITLSAPAGVSLTAEADRVIPLGDASLTVTSSIVGVNTGFTFNSKGCPGPATTGLCGVGAVELTFDSGAQSRSVCVQSQGYIRPGAC